MISPAHIVICVCCNLFIIKKLLFHSGNGNGHASVDHNRLHWPKPMRTLGSGLASTKCLQCHDFFFEDVHVKQGMSRCKGCHRSTVDASQLPRCFRGAIADTIDACRASPRAAYARLHEEDRIYYLIISLSLFFVACRLLRTVSRV